MPSKIPTAPSSLKSLDISSWLAEENLRSEKRRHCDSGFQYFRTWPFSLYTRRCKNLATHYRMQVCNRCDWQYNDYACWFCCQIFYNDLAMLLAQGSIRDETEAIRCENCKNFNVTFTAIPL